MARKQSSTVAAKNDGTSVSISVENGARAGCRNVDSVCLTANVGGIAM